MVEVETSMDKPKDIPCQQQSVHPGSEQAMSPAPQYDNKAYYKGSEKLKNKVALITGGDSGIGRSVSVLFAREGANVAIVYLKNHQDANETKKLVEQEGQKCVLLCGDVSDASFCREAVDRTMKEFGASQLDILVNHAGVQYWQEDFTKLSHEQLEKTFRTNVFSFFYMTQYALEHMKDHSQCCIINTTSQTAYKGKAQMIDYASTNGAITSFTRSLSQNLASRGIRVNGVAPGPIWTPFIPSSMPPDMVKNFGKHTALGRPGQPFECATSYVFLASEDSSYMTGQVLHPNGGTIVNS